MAVKKLTITLQFHQNEGEKNQKTSVYGIMQSIRNKNQAQWYSYEHDEIYSRAKYKAAMVVVGFIFPLVVLQ